MKLFTTFIVQVAAFLLSNFCGVITTSNETGVESPPRSLADEDPYLVLSNHTGKHVFTFATPNSFIQIQPNKVNQRYHIRDRRSVSLDFRTRLPHALLLYNGIKDRPANSQSYELYIMLDQGQLKVKHLFGDYSTTVVVGKGLNRDRWHHVNVMIDPHDQIIQAQVDQHSVSAPIVGLDEFPFYGYLNHEDKIDAVIFVGGLNESVPNLNISYLANTFIGCIKNVSLATSPLLSPDLEALVNLAPSLYENVKEGCNNKCHEKSQPCGLGSKCINHYDHVECDCFHSEFKGPICYNANIPSLNLHGYSYVTFTIYEWMDRVHSDTNMISMHFSTLVDDSMLFYAAGEIPIHNHISVTVTNGRLLISMDFGEAEDEEGHEPIIAVMGKGLTDGAEHVLKINHVEKKITVHLDNLVQEFNVTGENYHFYFDPDIYVGGGGHILRNREGLNSSNNFVGCLREVYYNEKSILWEMHEHGHHARYHGDGEPIFDKCVLHQNMPITIPFPDSGFQISNPNYEDPDNLDLSFEFKTEKIFGTLAYSDIRSPDDEGFWELKLVSNGGIQFFLQHSKGLEELNTIPLLHVKFNLRQNWTDVSLKYTDGKFTLKTGRDIKEVERDKNFQFSPNIIMATSVIQPNQGFVGCMRKVAISGIKVDSRQIVGSSDQINDIALDNCKYIDPCKRPGVCKHGGKCMILPGDVEVSCDCSETGYSGRHCHFANFKRTCEELGLLGYRESGVYKIDIDGNGPYPPVHVTCKFENGQHNSSDETKTIVEHNIANETDIWVKNDKSRFDFKVELAYREFTPEMLRSLISQSVRCSQYIKYECVKTPLALHQYTWFLSANEDQKVASIGDAARFSCPCSGHDPNVPPCPRRETCNCDANSSTRVSDFGTFTLPDRVGITEMNFLVPDNLTLDASSQITLGALECVEANTQRFVVTFKTFGSFLEAPGWKSGDLAFSFRTTRSSAILLYQPLLHPQDNAFSVFLANEHDLIFRIHLNGVAQNITVRSKRILSGGDWQQVWIDYDQHQVRFQINAENQMITMPHGQQFGFFEGTIYVGGAPAKYTDQEIIKDGLIGCFRGLVMNQQVVDLYSYMKFHKADIIKNCTPSCVPNPCKNDATCHENWGYFTCQCKNPFAQSGLHCEEDINVDGLTFLSQWSFIKRARQIADQEPEDAVQNIMTSNIYLNLRTYDSEALVLYANDHLNNFVQIHIEGGMKVVFLWNNGNKIYRLEVSHKGISHGKPIQIAVVRNANRTELHVNEDYLTATVGVYLLHKYNPGPWSNPEVEIFRPPRPFAPIGFYYQLFLGGFDPAALTPIRNDIKIPGMLGCLRGLKIGNEIIKIIGAANHNDVLQGCKMVCDSKPCQNGGVCIEDFQERAYSCECIQTSFFGRTCAEERGATFGGESFIRRRFIYSLPMVEEVELHFGFFASYAEADTVIVTAFIPGPMYSILFSITNEGHFMIREQHSGKFFGTTIDYQNFIDGKRHSVYYKRTKTETIFIVDEEEVSVFEIDPPGSTPAAPVRDQNQGEAYIGGVNEAVPEMNHFKRFKGCVSNVLIRFPGIELSPIEEYMGNKKVVNGIIDFEIFEGIKQEACGSLTIFRAPLQVDAQSNQSETTGAANLEWVKPLPSKVKLTGVRREETAATGSLFLEVFPYVSAIYLVGIVLLTMLYAYRINKRYKRKLLEELEDDSFYRRPQPMYKITPKPEPETRNFKQIDFDPAEKAKLLPSTAPSAPPKIHETSLTNNSKPINSRNDSIKKIDDNNADSSPSSNNNENAMSSESNSSASNTSLNSLNNTQILDQKDEDGHLLNGALSEPNNTISTIEERSNPENDDDALLKARLPSNNDMPKPNQPAETSSAPSTSKFLPASQVPALCINEHLRTFQSPIATLAGPFYRQFKRASKDSILSLD